MATPTDFEVRSADDTDPADLLQVLGDGYGRVFSTEWFQWKHRENPWGPSRSYVAADAGGILGVVFGLPWRLGIDGNTVETSRLVDGATTPRSARRGVFRSVVAAELSKWNPETHPGVVVATATPEAQAAHVKNGAVALEPVDSAYRSVRWSPAAVESGTHLLETFALPTSERRAYTAWDPAALRWRVDPRSGVDYEISRLAHSSHPHGLIHRTVSQHGLRTVVVTAHWGPATAVARLLRALAWRDKALAVLAPSGPGAADAMPRVRLRRGRSLLCVWDHRNEPRSPGLDNHAGWALCGLDLEGVV